MKKVLISVSICVLILFLSLFITIYDNTYIDNNKFKVVKFDKCTDGDTAWFKINGKTKKYRFLAIDSPEVDTELGINAKEYVCNILTNAKKIEVEYDVVGEKVDKYKRELVWVYVDGKLLQSDILSKGFAKIKYVYANYEYLEKLKIDENKALNKKIGIWKNYTNKIYNDYYTVTFNYTYKNKSINVLKNNMVDLIDNPYIEGCRFIGWKYGNYLFDLTTKINKDYKLVAEFDC